MSKQRIVVAAAIPASGEGMRGEKGHLPYLLAQAHGAVRASLDRSFADLAVTVPQFAVLTMIDSYEGLSCADVARLTNLAPQTINPIVNNLVKLNLISRHSDLVHGRIIRLSATAAGHRLRLECRKRAAHIASGLMGGFDKVEEKIVRRWLVDVAKRLNDDRWFRDLSAPGRK